MNIFIRHVNILLNYIVVVVVVNVFLQQAYLCKFLTKFIGEYNEKNLPIIKDQWRNIMINRLEDVLQRPYQIEVIN